MYRFVEARLTWRMRSRRSVSSAPVAARKLRNLRVQMGGRNTPSQQKALEAEFATEMGLRAEQGKPPQPRQGAMTDAQRHSAELAERRLQFEQGKFGLEQVDAQRKAQSDAKTASREEAFKQIEARNTVDGKLNHAAAAFDKAMYANPDNPNYDFSDPEYGVPARYGALDKIFEAGRKEFGPIDAFGSFARWHDGKPNKAQLESFYGGMKIDGKRLYLPRPDGSQGGNRWTRNYIYLSNLDPKTRALVERVTQVDNARKEAGLREQGG